MINASPEGKHMDMETFYKSIDFINRMEPFILIISGGEPTEHPEFFEIIKEARKCNSVLDVSVVSNGHFLFDDKLTERIARENIRVQITNDPRYYPVKIPEDKLKKYPEFIYETHIRHIYPLGRAVTNHIESYNTLAPKCFNLRSIARSGNCRSFKEVIKTLETLYKFCSPSINIDGSISAGESNLCHRIGTVEMYDAELFENLKTMKCNRCGMEDKLSPLHRSAIGI
jgi:hypothetical protein